MLIIGEVHTGLVQHGPPLSQSQSANILRLLDGDVVKLYQRPIAFAMSPERLTGVDCLMPSNTYRQIRGAGTVRHRAMVTGGRVLQGSSFATLRRGEQNRRLAWPYYLANPGIIETIGKVDWLDVRTGFVRGRAVPETLNIGGISGRAMDLVQQSEHLNRRPPLRAQRTVLRWTITPLEAKTREESDAKTEAVFTIRSDMLRTVELSLAPDDIEAGIKLCEDLALHDWLLTIVGDLLDVTRSSARPAAEKVSRLRVPVEHLLHLWMPGARLDDTVRSAWTALDQRPGFTSQWNASVQWIRDQIALETIALMHAILPAAGGLPPAGGPPPPGGLPPQQNALLGDDFRQPLMNI
jgi:hypothetical protein